MMRAAAAFCAEEAPGITPDCCMPQKGSASAFWVELKRTGPARGQLGRGRSNGASLTRRRNVTPLITPSANAGRPPFCF